jgi:aspartate aminotransferase
LKEISFIAKKYNILILSDEIYSELSFNKGFKSISEFYPEKTIISNGLSKWCGAGGWRLGYFIIPEALIELKNSIKNLASETFSSVSAPIQYAAIAAYNNNHNEYINDSRSILKAVGEYVFENLKSNTISINKPQGGFYLMPEFLTQKFSTSEEMCSNILNETGVALLPGSDFGFSKERMITRLSFTDFNGGEFMQNIKKTKKIDINSISKFAPKIIEGTKKLKLWSELI